MHWLGYKVISSFLYATSTHLDDHLVDNYSKNFGTLALLVISGIFGLVPVIGFGLYAGPSLFQLAPLHLILMLAAGVSNFFSLWSYLKALNFGDATAAIVFFRLTPVLSLVLGYIFLRETITTWQLIGMAITVAATFIFSFDFSGSKIKFRRHLVLLMLASVFFTVVAEIAFKFIALDYGLAITSFWSFFALMICSLIVIIFSAQTRHQLWAAFFQKTRRRPVFLALNATNEICYSAGDILSNQASLMAPVALTSALSGLTPVFTFLIEIVLRFINPRLIKTKYTPLILAQKIGGIALILIGGFFILA